MKVLSILIVAVAVAGTVAVAQTKPASPSAINETCPISGEPVDGKTYAKWNSSRIGLCCGGCLRQFNAWDDDRKNEFVALAARKDRTPPATAPAPTSQPAAVVPMSELYTLDTCIVSGQKLDSKGDPVVRTFDGREVRFCCAGCVKTFEADKAGYLAKIDAKVKREQSRMYPTVMCVLSGEHLTDRGPIVDYVHNNRLVRFCCRGCVRGFRRDPAKTLAALDQEIMETQRPIYPLTKCVVAGSDLGSMGEPAEIIAGNRLVRFCCSGCEGAFRKDPAKHLAILDAAWKRAGGMPKPRHIHKH